MNENEHLMYLIVRADLKMSKGKIAAQCGHAVQWLVVNNMSNGIKKNSFMQYLIGAHPKIVLKVSNEEELNNITTQCIENRISYYQVVDAGRTQIPPNTKTVLGIGPIRRSEVPSKIKTFKLL